LTLLIFYEIIGIESLEVRRSFYEWKLSRHVRVWAIDVVAEPKDDGR